MNELVCHLKALFNCVLYLYWIYCMIYTARYFMVLIISNFRCPFKKENVDDIVEHITPRERFNQLHEIPKKFENFKETIRLSIMIAKNKAKAQVSCGSIFMIIKCVYWFIFIGRELYTHRSHLLTSHLSYCLLNFPMLFVYTSSLLILFHMFTTLGQEILWNISHEIFLPSLSSCLLFQSLVWLQRTVLCLYHSGPLEINRW